MPSAERTLKSVGETTGINAASRSAHINLALSPTGKAKRAAEQANPTNAVLGLAPSTSVVPSPVARSA